MKLTGILSHPIIQVLSFCIILISGPYFGGPYIFYLYHAVQEGYAFAIAGIVAIGVTLVSIFLNRTILQLAGTFLMLLSLAIYFMPPRGKNSYDGFVQAVPFATILLFLIITILVIKKNIDRLLYHV